MGEEKTHINYSLADIEKYLQGRMNAKEMHALELAALNDPFLADAIEGYRNSSFESNHAHLNEIAAALHAKEEETKVVAMRGQKNFWWKIAASVILLTGLGLMSLYLLNNTKEKKSIAQHETISTAQNDTIKPTEELNANALSTKPADDLLATNAKKRSGSKKITQDSLSTNQNVAALAGKAEGLALRKDSAQQGIAMRLMYALPKINYSYSGRISNQENEPVPNARITLNDSNIIVADKNGDFNFHSHDTSVKASIAASGYARLTTPLYTDSQNNIVLKNKGFLLSEVPVTQLRVKKDSLAKSSDQKKESMPEGGWQSFQEYVYKKLHKPYDTTYTEPADGEFELEFSVNEEGVPYDFKVLRSTDDAVTSKAIDAIKEGPRWIVTGKDKKSRIKVQY